jgi:tetratricopeptide (TPR) repeat protein
MEHESSEAAAAAPQMSGGGDVADRVFFHRNQAILLSFQGRFSEAEACAREALRLKEDDLDTLNELGVAVWRQGRAAEAEQIFTRACRIKADDYKILTNLGLALADQGRRDEAAECYRAAIRAQADAFHAQLNLGIVLTDQGQFEEAEAWLQSGLRLRPDSPEALQNVGMNLGRQGRWGEAIGYYERALRQRPDFPDLHLNLAYALLAIGEFARGWPEHEWRLKLFRHLSCHINRTFWNGDDFRDRTILLHFEQGFGDTMQFIRFAPQVKRRGGRVAFLCQPELLRLLAHCKGIDLAFSDKNRAPECHIHAPVMSLPAILGTTLATLPAEVPYLFADRALVEHWRRKLAEAVDARGDIGASGESACGRARRARPFLIGISWQGCTGNPADRWRSYPLAEYAPLAELPGVRLVSLQVGEGVEQLRGLSGRFPVIELPGRQGREYAETAAIMCGLDLVIAPCSSVAHLAGGMGHRVWAALSYATDWRWMTGSEDCPWYPTMRLFRQTRFGDWEGVFRRMAEALMAELAARAALASEAA